MVGYQSTVHSKSINTEALRPCSHTYIRSVSTGANRVHHRVNVFTWICWIYKWSTVEYLKSECCKAHCTSVAHGCPESSRLYLSVSTSNIHCKLSETDCSAWKTLFMNDCRFRVWGKKRCLFSGSACVSIMVTLENMQPLRWHSRPWTAVSLVNRWCLQV